LALIWALSLCNVIQCSIAVFRPMLVRLVVMASDTMLITSFGQFEQAVSWMWHTLGDIGSNRQPVCFRLAFIVHSWAENTGAQNLDHTSYQDNILLNPELGFNRIPGGRMLLLGHVLRLSQLFVSHRTISFNTSKTYLSIKIFPLCLTVVSPFRASYSATPCHLLSRSLPSQGAHHAYPVQPTNIANSSNHVIGGGTRNIQRPQDRRALQKR